MGQYTDEQLQEAISGVAIPGAIAASNAEEDPDVAAKSVELSQSTGVPAPVIHADPENFQTLLKAQASHAIVSGNPQLGKYVASDPMAAKVSNDDYAQLDKVSQAIGPLTAKPLSPQEQNAFDTFLRVRTAKTTPKENIVQGATRGFFENFGTQPLASTFADYLQNSGPLGTAEAPYVRVGENAADLVNRGFQGIVGALAGGAGAAAGSPQLERDINAMPMSFPPEFGEAIHSSEPYIKSGKPVPVGVHPLVDDLKAEQAKINSKALGEAIQESAKSATRERAPGMFEDFVKQHTGEQTVGVSHEAVAALYGSKTPEVDDGLLGFVPDLAQQMQQAAETGSDIQVPLSDLLAKADPEVAKQLLPFIRARDGGMTETEVEAAKVATKVEHASPETITSAAMKVGDQVLTGPTHMQIFDKAHTDLGLSAPDFLFDVLGGPDKRREAEGFVTSTGRFVTREEAGQLAETEKQVESTKDTGGALRSEDLVSGAVDTTRQAAGIPSHEQNRYQDIGSSAVIINGKTYTGGVHSIAYSKAAADQGLDAEALETGGQGQEGFINNRNGKFIPREEANQLAVDFMARRAARKAADPELQKLRQEQEATLVKATNPNLSPAAKIEAGLQLEQADARYSEREKSVLAPVADLTAPAIRVNGKEFVGARHADALEAAKAAGISEAELDAHVEFGYRGDDGSFVSIEQAEQQRQGVEKPAQPQLFDKASAIGMNQVQANRYQALVQAGQEADRAAALRRAEALERKQQTPEWKAAEKDTRAQVESEVLDQPAIMADRAIRSGDIGKLDGEALSEEQKATLPKGYYRNGGENPDYVANLLGYASGDELIEDLAKLNQVRGDMEPGEYLKGLIDSETNRRMMASHGQLEDNIIEAAKQQVLSGTQLDLMHAQLEDLTGGELPFTRQQLQAMAKEKLGAMTMASISSDRFLASAGRAGRAIEDALLKGDAAEAFRQRQLQYTSLLYAKEAMAIEKAKARFDKIAKQFSKPIVSGVDQEYTNQIHGLLLKLGQKVNRSVQAIQSERALSEFIAEKEWAPEGYAGRDLHIPDFLVDPDFSSTSGKLTGDEMRQVSDAFKAMAFNGRDEAKIIRAGEKADFDATKREMIDELKALGPATAKAPQGAAKVAKTFFWSGINLESMFNRFDRGNTKGPFYQALTRVYTEASNYKEALTRETSAKIRSEIGRLEGLNKKVKNNLWINPRTNVPMDMTRREVLGILQNVGNEGNLKKLALGYNLTPEQVIQWVDANTTKEDWDRAQQIGDIFSGLFDKASTMSESVSGVGIDRIPLKEITAKGGTYKGWYNPLVANKELEGYAEGKGPIRGGDNLDSGYYKANTPQGYTKGRTGAIYPLALNLDAVPTRMAQMIHDIAMRPALIQLKKFFYDKEFKQAIRNHYGDVQAGMLEPFLRDMANAPNFRSEAESTMNEALGAIRQNAIATFIGMNPGTILKHGPTAFFNSLSEVGTIPWTKEFFGLLRSDPATANSNWTMAMSKSEQLRGRLQNWRDVLAGGSNKLAIPEATLKSLGSDVRTVAMYAGSAGVGGSDLLSAVPTFLAVYKKAIAEGEDEGAAVALGDRAVRRAHGSSMLTNKPAIARSNGIASNFTTFYGFFSHILQKEYEIAWRTKDAYGMLKQGEVAEGLKQIPKISGMIVSHMILPIVVEELVSPHTNPEHESWGVKAAKALAFGLSAPYIGIRDIVHAITEPQGGDFSASEIKSLADPIKDLASGHAFTPAKSGEFLKHMTILIGMATGLTNAQEGKAAEMIHNYFQGREHPQNAWQWINGLRYGKTKGSTRSFEDWKRKDLP